MIADHILLLIQDLSAQNKNSFFGAGKGFGLFQILKRFLFLSLSAVSKAFLGATNLIVPQST
jgi:hypothetical protein